VVPDFDFAESTAVLYRYRYRYLNQHVLSFSRSFRLRGGPPAVGGGVGGYQSDMLKSVLSDPKLEIFFL
jgi:hypothetical protein